MKNISFSIVLLFCFCTSFSQIVYTDINDYTGTGLGKPNLRDTFNIDLNNDATIDFKLIMWNPTFGTTPHYELKVSNTASSSRVGISYDDPFIASMAHALGGGDSIHAALATWKSEAQATSFQIFLAYNGGSSQMGGEFLGAGDKYLPLRFNIGANTHYGWVRINVNATCTQYIVKDYAYNSTPGQEIFAAQTTGIEKNTLNNLKLVVADKQLKVLNIENVDKTNFSICLYDINGRKFLQSSDFILELKNIPTGIYLADIQYGEARTIKKVFIQ